MVPDPETFIVTLTTVAGTAPAATRLKRFLKAALRNHGLRCVDYRELPPNTPPAHAQLTPLILAAPPIAPEVK